MNPFENASLVGHWMDSLSFVAPEMVLVGAACVLFTLAAFRSSRGLAFILTLLSLCGAAGVAIFVPEPIAVHFNSAHSTIDPTGLAGVIRWIALVGAFFFALIGWGEAKKPHAAEYFACGLIAAAGVSLVGRSNDLTTLFLALELISIPTYVLLYLPATSKAGQEAALKYFLLSVLSSAILLFGFSYLFGLTGTTNLTLIATAFSEASKYGPVSPMALVAMVAVIAGLGFRIAAVPFHFYAPDVYEGGPTGVVAQLSFVPKLAGFMALARVLGLFAKPDAGLPFDAERTLIPLTLWVIAVITLCFGNLLGLIQDNLKRLFAYSGIAHGGYMLIGLLVAGSGALPVANGLSALVVYLIAYGLMTVGAFAILGYLGGKNRPLETVDDLAGLGRSNPVAAAILGISLLSLIGLPLTAGFIGKFNLFASAFQVPIDTELRAMYRILAVIAVVNSAISAVYYLRIFAAMFLRAPFQPDAPTRAYPQLFAGALCALGTIAIGVYPQPLIDWVNKALAVG